MSKEFFENIKLVEETIDEKISNEIAQHVGRITALKEAKNNLIISKINDELDITKIRIERILNSSKP